MSYTNDFMVIRTGVFPGLITQQLNEYLPSLVKFFEDRGLDISAQNLSSILFTPETSQHKSVKLQVKVQDQIIPQVKNLKIFGVSFDMSFTFSSHCTDIRN